MLLVIVLLYHGALTCWFSGIFFVPVYVGTNTACCCIAISRVSCSALFLGVGGGGRSVLSFVHGRSRMTLDPRIPAMPGRSTSAFHQSGRHCLHQARSAVRCSASRTCLRGWGGGHVNNSYTTTPIFPLTLLQNVSHLGQIDRTDHADHIDHLQ